MIKKEDTYGINKARSERNIRAQIQKRIEWFEKENNVKVIEIRFYHGYNCISIPDIDQIEIITKEE